MIAKESDMTYEIEIKKKIEVFIASIYKNQVLIKSYDGWLKIKDGELEFNYMSYFNYESKMQVWKYKTNTIKFHIEEETNFLDGKKNFVSKETVIFEKSPFDIKLDDIDDKLDDKINDKLDECEYPKNFYIWQKVKE